LNAALRRPSREMFQGFVRKRAGHIGDINGFNANLNRYPDDDLVVIVLSNISITQLNKLVRI